MRKKQKSNRYLAQLAKSPGNCIKGTEEIAEIDIQSTKRVLRQLMLNPSLIHEVGFKSIRIDLYQLLKSFSLSSQVKLFTTQQISSIINESLSNRKWSDALVALYSMKELGKTPKLGSIQRWVSRLDWEFDSEMAEHLLFSIIQVSGQKTSCFEADCVWNSWPVSEVENNANAVHNSDFEFQIMTNEVDINYKHINIWYDKLKLDFFGKHDHITTACNVPGIEGGIAIGNVLSKQECSDLIHIAEKIGFEDASGYALSQETSNLGRGASGLVWLQTETTSNVLFSRFKHHLPDTLGSGRKLSGINCRFRFYKYLPGAVYKPHIDGAWPGSGSLDGKYQLDAFGDRHSRMTLVIYLNDNFEEGETRFYSCSESRLVKLKVKPKIGACLLFPHGDAHFGIVHEGCAVNDGIKYIIRTDVLYLN